MSGIVDTQEIAEAVSNLDGYEVHEGAVNLGEGKVCLTIVRYETGLALQDMNMTAMEVYTLNEALHDILEQMLAKDPNILAE